MQSIEHPFASPEIESGRDIYSKDFEEGLPSWGNHTHLEVVQEIEEAGGIEKVRGEGLDEMKEEILSIANEVSHNKVENIRQYYDDDFGFTIEIKVNQNDKEAFETWLCLIDKLKPLVFGSLVTVDWTGENILSEEEFVHKAVKVMLKSGVGPKRTDRFSAVEELEEGW
jgi:hypothetical protein